MIDHTLIKADLGGFGFNIGIFAGVADIEATGLAGFVDDGVKRVVAMAVGVLITRGDADADMEFCTFRIGRRERDFDRHDEFGEGRTLRAFGEFIFVRVITEGGKIADAVLGSVREGFTVRHHKGAHALGEVNDRIDVIFAGICGAEAALGDAGNGGRNVVAADDFFDLRTLITGITAVLAVAETRIADFLFAVAEFRKKEVFAQAASIDVVVDDVVDGRETEIDLADGFAAFAVGGCRRVLGLWNEETFFILLVVVVIVIIVVVIIIIVVIVAAIVAAVVVAAAGSETQGKTGTKCESQNRTGEFFKHSQPYKIQIVTGDIQ